MPSQRFELHLPRWDTAWEITGYRQSKTTKKVLPVKVRKTWDPLQGNAKSNNWGSKAKATKEVINAVAWVAHSQNVPQCKWMMVQLNWAPGDMRRADEDNLFPLFKACCDGLARGRGDLPGLHLVPDDSAQYMRKEHPRIVRPPHPGGLWLMVVASW